jgi:LEA14-like dessication related protein
MRKIAIVLMMVGVMGLVAFPCLAAEEKAAPAKPAPMMGNKAAAKMAAVKAPVVKLERIDVANIQSFYLEVKEKKGAIMNLGFVFALENPNNFRVMLDDIKFSVNFEDFYMASLNYYDDNYIPAKTTDYIRVNGYFDSMTGVSTLNTVGGAQLKEMNKKADELLKKWWEEIGDFKFPIKVMGAATFVGPDGKIIIVQFEGTFPPKP